MRPITCQALHALGKSISDIYTTNNLLSEIAPAHMQSFLAEHTWDESIFLKDFMLNCSSPQLSAKGDFGEPPMTVYFSTEKEFCIDIYRWLKADTNIHDHGFDGAFALLQGRSLQGNFHFETTENLKQSAQRGLLTPEKLEWLDPGEIRPIKAGPQFIHQIIHFGKPSYTMVIRTTGTRFKPNPTIQLNYDLRTMATMSHPQDYNWVKFRLLNQISKMDLLTFAELDSLGLFQHQTFLTWLCDNQQEHGLYQKECREIQSSHLKGEMLSLLSREASILMLALDFYREKKPVWEWITNQNNQINHELTFNEILSKLLERKVLNETAEQSLRLLWKLGYKKTLLALDSEESFLLKLRDELAQITFLGFLSDERLNP